MNYKTVELNGKTYYYNGQYFFDETFILLQGDELQKVSTAYYAQFDYTQFDARVLGKYIQALKDKSLHAQARKVIEYGLEKFDNKAFIEFVLPLYTSCCREMGQPQLALEKVEQYFGKVHFSAMLCTSIAAAYCDIKDYKNATKFAQLAYAKQGGGKGYKTELSLVFLRIRKETNKQLCAFADDDR